MLTLEETLQRLEKIENELATLRRALRDGVAHSTPSDRTSAFLEKCGGWEDTRTPEEIIADIRASRVNTRREPCFSDEEEEQ